MYATVNPFSDEKSFFFQYSKQDLLRTEGNCSQTIGRHHYNVIWEKRYFFYYIYPIDISIQKLLYNGSHIIWHKYIDNWIDNSYLVTRSYLILIFVLICFFCHFMTFFEWFGDALKFYEYFNIKNWF